MIKLFSKGQDRRISKNLILSEVKCKCKNKHCRHVIVCDEVMGGFERLRMLCGDLALYVLSGHRCSSHNFECGGVSLSQHLLGFALDIKKPNWITWQTFEKLCHKAGFSKVILYKKQNFAHCDMRGLV